MNCFSTLRASALGAVVLMAWVTTGHAGPCTARIDEMQARVDAAVDRIAGRGASAAESTGARLHREPTPGSIARSEERLGEGASVEKALSALGQARAADQAGNVNGCEQALAEAQQAIGQ